MQLKGHQFFLDFLLLLYCSIIYLFFTRNITKQDILKYLNTDIKKNTVQTKLMKTER